MINDTIVGFMVQTFFTNQVHFQNLSSKTISASVDEIVNYHINWETDKIQRLMLTPQYIKESFLT